MKKLLYIILVIFLFVSVIPINFFGITANAATGGYTGDCVWNLDGTILTISGKGYMDNYTSSSHSPWGESITEVIIEYGVKNIGNYSFSNCSGLIRVTVPNSVIDIGTGAFSYCTGITNITIPSAVKKLALVVSMVAQDLQV